MTIPCVRLKPRAVYTGGAQANTNFMWSYRMSQNIAREYRCGCNKLLAKGQVISLEIKCPRCKKINKLSAESIPNERHRASTFGACNELQN